MMASYPAMMNRPRPQTSQGHAGQSSSRAQSRFVEGSMNDRVSNVPPPDFLGPEEIAVYERQFYIDPAPAEPPAAAAARPISTSDQQSTVKKSFFAPLWDGVRERLHLTRSKSATNITSNNNNNNKTGRPISHQEQQQTEQLQQGGGGAAAELLAGAYPTREEVMESYKSLMDSGFFAAHAIQGTRHPLRTSSGETTTEVATVPAPPKKTFSQHMTQQQHPEKSVLAFSSIPYSATKAPSSGDPPLMPFIRPDTGSRQPSYNRQNGSSGASSIAESPQRGTKRAMADIAGGATDREWPETGARKLAKKLRKSASRISADMSLPPTRNASAAVGGGSGPETSAAAMSGRTGSSLLGKEPPRHSISTMRSFSSSWKSSDSRSTGNNPNRLTKAKKVLGGGRRRRRSSTSRSPARPVVAASSHHPPTPQRPAPSIPETATSSAAPEPMVIDSPTRPSFDGIVNGLSVPSFHYPQRMRPRSRSSGGGGPLSVAPDSNRGIPSVPRIPDQFKAGRPEAAGGGEGIGIRDSGVGDVENCEVW